MMQEAAVMMMWRWQRLQTSDIFWWVGRRSAFPHTSVFLCFLHCFFLLGWRRLA